MLGHLFRTVVAFVAGFTAAFALVIGVELLSNILYPLPSDFGHSQEEICLHVAKYPAWVLSIVVVTWGLTGWIATWIAQRIGNVYSAGLLGLLLVAAVALNISMLPYPLWFKIVMMLVMPSACLVGAWMAGRAGLQANSSIA